MFGALKAKNPYEQEAGFVYAAVLERVRQPVFYKEYGVPDTMDGRFDLLLLHEFIVIHCLIESGGDFEDFNQALFDVTFADMDQTLREMGIGDMGVPKHMRRMMKAFNGRMHAYHEGIEDDGAFEQALHRNLYGTAGSPDPEAVEHIGNYVQANIDFIKRQPAGDIMAGKVAFTDL